MLKIMQDIEGKVNRIDTYGKHICHELFVFTQNRSTFKCFKCYCFCQ